MYVVMLCYFNFYSTIFQSSAFLNRILIDWCVFGVFWVVFGVFVIHFVFVCVGFFCVCGFLFEGVLLFF